MTATMTPTTIAATAVTLLVAPIAAVDPSGNASIYSISPLDLNGLATDRLDNIIAAEGAVALVGMEFTDPETASIVSLRGREALARVTDTDGQQFAGLVDTVIAAQTSTAGYRLISLNN